MHELALLNLLQLASPSLPVGAYSYSEGLEILVEQGAIASRESLQNWLERSLQGGAVRIEAAVMLRAYRAAEAGDREALSYWNAWASAARESEELRSASWQMGSALRRLLVAMQPQLEPVLTACGNPCNFAIAFGIAAEHWHVSPEAAILGYLHSWASNLIGAGVKLIPLGQTAGQVLLLDLHPHLMAAAGELLTLADDDLYSCSWGLALASMQHETQYTRLFRS